MSAYRVEVDTAGCAECGHGATYTVVTGHGDDEVAISDSFEDREFTEWIADQMNMAAERGREQVAAEARDHETERLTGELSRLEMVIVERVGELVTALGINPPGEDAVANWSAVVREVSRLKGELETAQKANDSLRQLLREKGMSDEGINSCLRLDRAKERFQ